MDLLFFLQAITIFFLTLLATFKCVRLIKAPSNNQHPHDLNQLPEPPGTWPIIGHLHLLGGRTPIFRTLGVLADKHGPIFSLRLGHKLGLVVSSYEVVKECFTTNDHTFLNRPTTAASTHVAYGHALLAFAPYGPYWRELRKIASLELLSKRRLDLLCGIRAMELETCIKQLYSRCEAGLIVDMSQWISLVSMNSMVAMISGKRYKDEAGDDDDDEFSARRFGESIRKVMYFSGLISASDFVRFIGWLDIQGHVKSMKCNALELDKIMSGWLEEHVVKRRERDYQNQVDDNNDFMDTMLSTVGNLDGSVYGYKSETVVKATTLNLVMASVDTTSVTITWALSLLLNHPQALHRAQEELDFHVGRQRWARESDLTNLTYLQAIIKETLRLYPAGPLSVPRESIEDCVLSGFHVPKGTTLFVNIWKLHRDPRVWADPDEFKPERFLDAHVDVDIKGKQFEYVPFSSGRRACPGISLAMRSVSLTVARVLQGFNMATVGNEPVDMSEGLGLTLPKMTPLEILLTPRLGGELYK